MIISRAIRKVLYLAPTALALGPMALAAQQKVDLRRAAAPDIALRVQGAFASLRVIGWSKDSVVITGMLPSGFRLDGGIGGSDGAPSRGAKIYIEGPEAFGPSGGTLEVRLPVNATLWAKASSATIDISGITGGLDVNIVGGSVQVSGNPRELSVASMDGTITVLGSPLWTRLKSADGNILMRGGSTDAAFTTVSGTVRVGDGTLERARFETVSGGIEFQGEIARGGMFNADTHSGAVDIRLSSKASVEIDAGSIAGTIENSLTRQRAEIGRDGRGAALKTSVGQGNARLVIRTFKGSIRLSGR